MPKDRLFPGVTKAGADCELRFASPLIPDSERDYKLKSLRWEYIPIILLNCAPAHILESRIGLSSDELQFSALNGVSMAIRWRGGEPF